MNDSHIETLEQVRQFLDGAAVMKITIPSKTECYRWIRGVLVRFQYRTLGKADKGLIRRYLQQISDYSRAQIARLIKQYQKTGRIQRRQRTVKGFTSKYTGKISACWHSSMSYTVRSAVRPPRSSVSAPGRFSSNDSTSVLPESRSRTYTT